MVTAEIILNQARNWLGRNETDGSHREIIDIYNAHQPLAVGYPVKYTDAWCDTFVSAVAIAAGAVDLIGTECGCERHVKIWQEKEIWQEDGRITPKPGDIIVFNWSDTTQENDGFSDHVGFVEKVEAGMVTTIEGNRDNQVKRCRYSVGDGRIRGYACPQYDEETRPESEQKTVEEAAREVICGKWGSGEDRRQRLEAAGLDADAVQKEVNKLLKPVENYHRFVRELQEAIGAKADGIVGPETLGKTVTLSAHKNNRHPAVKPVQKRLFQLGYTVVGKADGIAGPRFTEAVKLYQKDHHCWVDGEITAGNKTWRQLLADNKGEEAYE